MTERVHRSHLTRVIPLNLRAPMDNASSKAIWLKKKFITRCESASISRQFTRFDLVGEILVFKIIKLVRTGQIFFRFVLITILKESENQH